MKQVLSALRQTYRVKCIGSDEWVHMLQESSSGHDSLSDFLFFKSRLEGGESNVGDRGFDLIFLNLELGQPVPVSHLKKIEPFRGIVSVVQPTPKQLIELGQLDQMYPVEWNGHNYRVLIAALEKMLNRQERHLKLDAFSAGINSWLKENLSKPEILMIRSQGLEKSLMQKTLPSKEFCWNVGAVSSHCEIKLPLHGEAFIGQLQRKKTQLSFTKGSEIFDVKLKGDPNNLNVGDSILINGFSLEFQRSPQLSELLGLARQFDQGVSEKSPSQNNQEENPFELLKKLATSMKTGELRVNMDSRYAYIYIVNGMIDHCVCGVVTGIKALFRVLSWNTVGWVFHEGKQAPIIYKRIGLNWVEFVNLYYEWQKRWTALYPYIPPPSLKLKVAPSAYHQKTKWSFMEVQVLAFVCEHKFVKSVVNHCPLVDVDVYDGLIQMRKAKILEIEKS